MFREIIRDLLTWIGAMTVMVAVVGIAVNEVLYGNWYGETEAQRRERIRKERKQKLHKHDGVV